MLRVPLAGQLPTGFLALSIDDMVDIQAHPDLVRDAQGPHRAVLSLRKLVSRGPIRRLQKKVKWQMARHRSSEARQSAGFSVADRKAWRSGRRIARIRSVRPHPFDGA
jgi:hypothetical protein